jgi:protein-L-isoaspartate(D-aspartate) O-methyltransferase
MTSLRTRVRLLDALRAQGIRSDLVLEIMKEMPRHRFVDEALASRAYENTSLPIGFGQTISSPYMVARMTEALLQGRRSLGKVLEIGTGSGYQTAILARLADAVYTIERIDALLTRARWRFHRLRLANITTRHGDGANGWPEQAPFDGIIAAAAPAEIPVSFLHQLAPGGRLVMPRGTATQTLLAITRTPEGYVQEELEPVTFVPMLPGDQ